MSTFCSRSETALIAYCFALGRNDNSMEIQILTIILQSFYCITLNADYKLVVQRIITDP